MLRLWIPTRPRVVPVTFGVFMTAANDANQSDSTTGDRLAETGENINNY